MKRSVTLAGLVLAGVALATWLALREGGQALGALGGGDSVMADGYRTVDDDTIVILGTGGEGAWVRPTNVVETDSEVRVTIRSLRWPLPAGTTGLGIPTEWRVELGHPLGDRRVVDGYREVPLQMALPTLPHAGDGSEECPQALLGPITIEEQAGVAGVPVAARLPDGERVDLVWDRRFTAQFAPLIIVDRAHGVVAEHGDVVWLTGGETPDGAFYVCGVSTNGP